MEKVSLEHLTKQNAITHYLDLDGPIYRLRCKCVVVGPKSCTDTAQKIVNGVEMFEWKLHNSIAGALSDVGRPYRGEFEIMGTQVHNGQALGIYGQHFIHIS